MERVEGPASLPLSHRAPFFFAPHAWTPLVPPLPPLFHDQKRDPAPSEREAGGRCLYAPITKGLSVRRPERDGAARRAPLNAPPRELSFIPRMSSWLQLAKAKAKANN
eukprot:scaffold301041_cov32-Tisochrysis_lutea.AAC.1